VFVAIALRLMVSRKIGPRDYPKRASDEGA